MDLRAIIAGTMAAVGTGCWCGGAAPEARFEVVDAHLDARELSYTDQYCARACEAVLTRVGRGATIRLDRCTLDVDPRYVWPLPDADTSDTAYPLPGPGGTVSCRGLGYLYDRVCL